VARWRLIESRFGDACWNMAVDEALLTHFAPGPWDGVLRIYGWKPPAISLGYFQSVEPPAGSESACGGRLPTVRRLTGGGAIVHGNDLTYSVCVPVKGLSGRQASLRLYADMNRATVKALALLGVAAHERGAGRREVPDAPFLCFARESAYDVVVRGAKVAGGAQRRRRGVILQQGSIALSDDGTAPGMTSVAAALGRSASFAEVRQALTEAVQRAFGVELVSSDLTAPEQRTAAKLARDKYPSDAWNWLKKFEKKVVALT